MLAQVHQPGTLFGVDAPRRNTFNEVQFCPFVVVRLVHCTGLVYNTARNHGFLKEGGSIVRGNDLPGKCFSGEIFSRGNVLPGVSRQEIEVDIQIYTIYF